MRLIVHLTAFLFAAAVARAQLQVELKFKRLQYIPDEPIMATVKITNLAGRDVKLQDKDSQSWFDFQINAGEGRLLVPLKQDTRGPALHLEAGGTVTRKINLTPLFPVQDSGSYHVRANVYFADLDKFYYSPVKVFQVAAARSIWRRTAGIPDGLPGAGETRTYSLLSSRFPDYTCLYVRVDNQSSGIVCATYALGRIIAYGEPQTELDRANQLHVLHCAGPRRWAYSHIGLNGELLARSIFMETKTRPRLRHASDGAVTVTGGMLDVPIAPSARRPDAKMSAHSADSPADN